MSTYPETSIEDRVEQPYVGSTAAVTMDDFRPVADRLPEIFGRLAQLGLEPAGAPFFRYRVIDMERELIVQAGVPVAAQTEALPDGLEADALPAGRYVTTTYTGSPQDLVEVTARLLRWAEDQGLAFDTHPSEQGEVWGSRVEFMETDPAEVPDQAQWQTTLAFRLTD